MERVDVYGFEFLGGKDVMPIGGFYFPTPKEAQDGEFQMPNFISDEYFSMIADCGVNFLSYCEVFYDSHPDEVVKMLELGEKHGVGISVSDRRLSNWDGKLTLDKVRESVDAYCHCPAFVGVYGVDEPTTEYYTGPKESIAEYAPKMNFVGELGIWAFGNLLPCYNEEYRERYNRYVEEWLNTCKVKMLMWDHYVHDKFVEKIDYFYSLSYGREKAAEYHIPFWVFIQAGSQWETGSKHEDSDGYYPNEGEFLWNVNTSLAYGAKGISYFPLIQPLNFAYAKSQPYDFERNGLIGASGIPNRWWHYAKIANRQIASVDEILMNSVSKGVIVTSEQAKQDNADSSCILPGISWKELSDIIGNVLIGCFDYRGKSVFYVVNYDMQNPQKVMMKFCKECELEVTQDGQSSICCGKELELEMRAGEGVLVVIG